MFNLCVNMELDEYEDLYGRDEYFWGKGTSTLATKTFEHARSTPENTTLIDVGAGECRDSVFFADYGFDVWSVDLSTAGLSKGERLANERDVSINTINADVNDFEFPRSFDVVHSTGVVQYIHPDNRDRQFERFKRDTTSGGINSILAIVDHPETSPGPDWSKNEWFYERGDLEAHYSDWEILHSEEMFFNHVWEGDTNLYVANIVIAQKP